MTIEDIIAHYRTNIKTNKKRIVITGGEPTLQIDELNELITKLKEIEPNTNIALYTNGYKLNEVNHKPLHRIYLDIKEDELIPAGKSNYVFDVPLFDGKTKTKIVVSDDNYTKFMRLHTKVDIISPMLDANNKILISIDNLNLLANYHSEARIQIQQHKILGYK